MVVKKPIIIQTALGNYGRVLFFCLRKKNRPQRTALRAKKKGGAMCKTTNRLQALWFNHIYIIAQNFDFVNLFVQLSKSQKNLFFYEQMP